MLGPLLSAEGMLCGDKADKAGPGDCILDPERGEVKLDKGGDVALATPLVLRERDAKR